MGKITRIDANRNLSDRRQITLELPEFIIRAFHYRIAERTMAPRMKNG
jgi:hypothetical protein